ncbi:MAG: nucleoside/nucleotide kinase family protein [Ilumatobacteraceae bacterium]
MADELISLAAVRATVAARAEGRSRTIVGLVGPPGAGKTHVARALAGVLPVAVVPMDGFHLPNRELARLGRVERKGAPDTFDVEAFVELLTALRAADAPVVAPSFSRRTDEPIAGAVVVEQSVRTVVVEGNYLLLDEPPWSRVASLIDVTMFVDAPCDVRRDRLLIRQERRFGDREAARRWVDEVDEPNARLVEATRSRADHVVALEGSR